MILLLTISIIFHQSYHDQYSSYCKDSFEPSQGIETKHFYPKHLFKRVVLGKGDKILLMSLKKVISQQSYAIQNLVIMQVVWDKNRICRGRSPLAFLA
jgi:hypothetical protein